CNPDDWMASARARAAILRDSRARVGEWIQRHGLDCHFTASGLDYVFRDARNFQAYAAECEALDALGITTEVIDGPAYLRREPALRDGVGGAIHFPGDAHLRPDRYTAGLARVIRGLGGVIEEQAPVRALQPDADGVTVQLADGSRRRGREAVVAMAAWTPELVRPLGVRLPIQPGKGYSITYGPQPVAPRPPRQLKAR